MPLGRLKNCFIFAPVILLAALPLWGGPPPNPGTLTDADQKLFEKALDFHQQGVNGDRNATIQAYALFAEMAKRHPENPVILAFFGSASTLRARDAIFFRKMDYLRQGLENLDRAVALAPDDCHVRAVRAINNYQLPSFIGRRSLAQEDFAILYASFSQTNDPLEREQWDLRRFTLYHGGLFALRERRPEARSFFQLALTAPSEMISDNEIKRRLREAERLINDPPSRNS